MIIPLLETRLVLHQIDFSSSSKIFVLCIAGVIGIVSDFIKMFLKPWIYFPITKINYRVLHDVITAFQSL